MHYGLYWLRLYGRCDWADLAVQKSVQFDGKRDATMEYLDRILTNPIPGVLAFLVVMAPHSASIRTLPEIAANAVFSPLIRKRETNPTGILTGRRDSTCVLFIAWRCTVPL